MTTTADTPTTGDNDIQQAILARFECARCGTCCKGDGIVRLTSAEADRMAAHLGLKRRDFLKHYAVQLDTRHWILRDRFVPGPAGLPGREQWCIFLERHSGGQYACRLGDAKPRQCKVFPYDWTNPDSLETCVGLRLAQAAVRREAAAGQDPPKDSDRENETSHR